jgi:hypothetical protein
MKKCLLVSAFVFLAFAFFIEAQAASQSAPTGAIYYTGQLDGFLGSWPNCQPPNTCRPTYSAKPWYFDKEQGTVLVGLGDNLAPNLPTGAAPQIPNRTGPQPGQLDMVQFMRNYDAVVPGKQDFIFGVNFLQAAVPWVNMVANNLVVQLVPPSSCAVSPTLTPTAPFLPDQVSLAISSSGSGGGGSGGKGGKGGKGGGGSAGAAGSSSGGGGSGGGGGAAASGCTAGAHGAEQHKLSAADAKNHPKPNMRWPNSNDVYPWTSAFTIDAIPGLDQGSLKPALWVCPAEQKGTSETTDTSENPDPSSICTPLKSDPHASQPASGVQRFSADVEQPAYTVMDTSGQIADPPAEGEKPKPYRLYRGTEGRLCYFFTASKGGPKQQCSDTFTVQTPLFNFAWRLPEKSGEYVTFGALAPDTLNGVADTDKGWITDPTTHVAPQIQVNDPTSAIQQALQTFNLVQGQFNQPKRYGVVLAQMTQGEARTLANDLSAGKVWFSSEGTATQIKVVLSEADQYDVSPNTKITVKESDSGSIPVFTPAPLFESVDCLHGKGGKPDDQKTALTNAEFQVNVRGCLAKVTFPDGSIDNTPASKSQNLLGINKPLDRWDSPYCSDNDQNERDKNGKLDTTPLNPLNHWECQTLNRMRLDTSSMPAWFQNGTDIAILEEKDFDFVRGNWTDISHSPDPATAARILWRAGHLTRVSLMGSTIKALLDQNTALGKKNFQSRRDVMDAEQLKIDGIFKNSNEQYYINGMSLMATQIYSVATSDQLANSTSDYPQLAQKDLNAPALYPLLKIGETPHSYTLEIADIGAEVAPKGSKPTPLDQGKLEVPYIPFPATHPAPAKSSPPAFTYSNRTKDKATDSTLENESQNRPYFHIAMQQLAVAYALNKPNQTSASIGSNLSGVANPNVASPYSRSWSVLHGARLEWYEPRTKDRFPWFEDVGVDTQVNLAESLQGSLTPSKAAETTTGQPVPANSTSITGNSAGFSPFLEFHLPKQPDWKPFVARFLYSRNLLTQPNYLSGCAATSPTCVETTTITAQGSYEFYLSQATSGYWDGSAGARYERNDFQYIELGYLEQKSTNVLSALTFVPGPNFPNSTAPKCLSVPSGKSYSCPLTGTETSTTFATGIYPASGSSLTPSYATFHQDGAYVDAFWNHFVKRGKGMLIQESIFGNYFAYGNRNESILTHYAFNSSSSVLLQLPANFSIGPTYSEFVYQSNAAKGTQRSLTRITAGVQFNYSFDWHTGVSAYSMVGNTQ